MTGDEDSSNVTVSDAERKLLSPWAGHEAEAVVHHRFEDGDAVYEVLMPDGTTMKTTRRECGCGNVIDVKPTSEITSWHRKLGQACEHQRAVLEAVNVGGTCSCGELKVEATDHTDAVGNVVMQSFSCIGCGTRRVEQ